jgi:hypothetical protein
MASALPPKQNGDAQKVGVGLWIPFSAASELSKGDRASEFGKWLAARRLNPFTINGFPYDNFHLPVVKHAVYKPTWAEPSRLEYTVLLAKILSVLQESDADAESNVASISTLPIGWPSDDDANQIEKSGANFRQLARELEQLEKKTGRLVTVAIEPEPGCLFDRCEHIVEFFAKHLPDPNHRRYLSVCHDVCHSAVMFEDQAMVLNEYRRAGIVVGKVQVSSAIDVPFSEMSIDVRDKAVAQLAQFAEDRYLHQTGCRNKQGEFRLVEDLPQWLAESNHAQDTHLRIHFHVPIFLQQFGALQTTRDDIERCLSTMYSPSAPVFTGHWEVETYAWTVMPTEMRTSGLGKDIENELNWFRKVHADAYAQRAT